MAAGMVIAAVGGARGVERACAGICVWWRQRQRGGMRFIGRRLQLLERLVKYGICGAVRCVAVADAVEVKINRRWEPHVILTLCLGLALSLSLSLTLRLVVVRGMLVLVSVLLLLLHFHFHFGRLFGPPVLQLVRAVATKQPSPARCEVGSVDSG